MGVATEDRVGGQDWGDPLDSATVVPPEGCGGLSDRQIAAATWLDAVFICDSFERVASACLTQIVDPAVPGIDPASLWRRIIGSDRAIERYNAAYLDLRDLMAEDPSPIRVGPWEVYLNDRGRPAYRPLAAEEVAG